MKAFLRIIPILALASTWSLAHAQQAGPPEDGHSSKKGKRLESGVFMKEGQMMTMRDGTAQPMTDPITLTNGTKVMPDGSVTMADGKTLMLHNGQYLRPDGSLLEQGSVKNNGLNKRSL